MHQSPMIVSMLALVIGDSGQDGQILSLKLQSLGMKVIGVSRSRVLFNGQSREPVDLVSPERSYEFLSEYQPKLVFHVAAIHGSSVLQSSVISQQGQEMHECHVGITQNVLNWMVSESKDTRLHVALSSQMYTANQRETNVDELTETSPINFYGQTKVDAWNLLKRFRNEYALQANASILFNHASRFSKKGFVFSILAEQFAKVIKGEVDSISVRDPSARIDVSSALEVCDAMINSVNMAPTEDFVFASGKLTYLSEVIENTIRKFGLPESCFFSDWKKAPNELSPKNTLIANPKKASDLLGWRSKMSPEDILEVMIIHEINRGVV